MTEKEVVKLFRLISELYDRFEVSAEKVEAWHWVLKDQDADVVMRNTKKYVLDNKFPPTIADLKEKRTEAHSQSFLNKLKEWEENASEGKSRS